MKKLKELLGDYFVNVYQLSSEEEYTIEYVDAQQFLIPERADLIVKLAYIESKVKKKNIAFAKEMYIEHIRAFSNGTFIEPGSVEKNSAEKYIDTFDHMIEEIPKIGFSHEISVVPVGETGILLNGSHRVAIAIYFGLKVPIVRIPRTGWSYDLHFFENKGLDSLYLDYIAYQFIKYTKKPFILCLWPSAYDVSKIIQAEKIIKEGSTIVYKKEIKLNYNGLKQVMIHIYGNQDWAGSFEDGFKGIDYKVKPYYRNRAITTVYLLNGPSLDVIVNLKSKIRDIFQIGNHSVHTTDTCDEAIELGQVLVSTTTSSGGLMSPL